MDVGISHADLDGDLEKLVKRLIFYFDMAWKQVVIGARRRKVHLDEELLLAHWHDAREAILRHYGIRDLDA